MYSLYLLSFAMVWETHPGVSGSLIVIVLQHWFPKWVPQTGRISVT